MKKKLLALMMTLMMVMCMMPAMAFAEEAPATEPDQDVNEEVSTEATLAADYYTKEIASEEDLVKAANKIATGSDDAIVMWNITKDFTLTKRIVVSKKGVKLSIDGKGHTITAEQNGALIDHVFDFVAVWSNDTNVYISDLNIVVGDGFRNGIAVQKNIEKGSKRMNLIMNDVAITMSRSAAPMKDNQEKLGAAIINNDSIVELQDGCSITTDKYCWAAIDVDNSNLDTELIFDDDAVEFTDGRTSEIKAKEALVKVNRNASHDLEIKNADEVNLAEVSNGYNPIAKVTFDVAGIGTAPETKTIPTQTKVENPGNLTCDGCTFGGWYADANCNTAWNFDTLIQGDTTIYAKWIGKTAFIVQGKSYKKSVAYSWNAVEGAASYKVYQVKCGKKKYKKIKTTSATSYTKKKLKRKTTYKAYVVAYNAAGQAIAQTPIIHNRTKGGSRSNATAVGAAANASIKVGATTNVGAAITAKDSKKKLLWKNHVSAPIRYYSADPAVATVDANGNVYGVAAGIANIYSVAPTGVCAVTKITVEKPVPTFIINCLNIHNDDIASYSVDGGKTYLPCLSQSEIKIFEQSVIIRCDRSIGGGTEFVINNESLKQGQTKTFSNTTQITQTLNLGTIS